MAEDKRLIIDEDWKKEAKNEKDKLADEGKAKPEKADAPGGRTGPLPDADFTGMVSMLATQAFFALGLIRLKGEPETQPDLEAAKFNIDMLGMLEAKTKGNLDAEESKLIEDTLHNLRMAYVRILK